MNNAWLEAFITVYQTESVSKAADLLFVTQPSITNRLQSLETELGTVLFYRSKRKMTPTQAGVTFYPYALRIIEEWHQGSYEVQNLNHSLKGELSIAIFYSGLRVFSSLFLKFSDLYPDIKLIIKTTHSEDIAGLVENHIVNVGFTLFGGNKKLENYILYRDEYVLAAHPSHPLTHKSLVQFHELKSEKFILTYSGGDDYTFIKQGFEQLNLTPQIISETDNLEFARLLILNKKGIAFLPKRLIEDELNNHEVAVIPLQYKKNLSRNHYLVWLKSDMTNPLQKVFIEFVLSEIIK